MKRERIKYYFNESFNNMIFFLFQNDFLSLLWVPSFKMNPFWFSITFITVNWNAERMSESFIYLEHKRAFFFLRKGFLYRFLLFLIRIIAKTLRYLLGHFGIIEVSCHCDIIEKSYFFIKMRKNHWNGMNSLSWFRLFVYGNCYPDIVSVLTKSVLFSWKKIFFVKIIFIKKNFLSSILTRWA